MNDEPLPQSEIILYQTEDGLTRIQCRLENETLWLSQVQIAELFQTSVPNINLHLKDIYSEAELAEAATIKSYLIVRTEGTRQVSREVLHYCLPAILAVGFRVRSHRGTQFRQWAATRLSEYLVKGFTMDDDRLKNPPGKGQTDYFDELLETNWTAPVNAKSHCFSFFLMNLTNAIQPRQWRQHVAVGFSPRFSVHTFPEALTGATEICKNRSCRPCRGYGIQLNPVRGLTPTATDCRPSGAVIDRVFSPKWRCPFDRIVNLYIEYAELQAMERKPMTMGDWIAKLDEFLKISGRQLLDNAGKISAEQARAKAEQEYVRYAVLDAARGGR
ncbi:MAG: RhuM family protein [Planctomycetaceae bacterium]